MQFPSIPRFIDVIERLEDLFPVFIQKCIRHSLLVFLSESHFISLRLPYPSLFLGWVLLVLRPFKTTGRWSEVLMGGRTSTFGAEPSDMLVNIKSKRLSGLPFLSRCVGWEHSWTKSKLRGKIHRIKILLIDWPYFCRDCSLICYLPKVLKVKLFSNNKGQKTPVMLAAAVIDF